MERAARLIKNNKLSKKVFSEEDFARAVWPAAVGKAIAAHTCRITLVRSTLVVEVEDAIWQKQLFTLRGQILDRLRRVTASDSVTEIEFRIALKRRQPQRAARRQSSPEQDEADSIQDAVLKKVYRLSRNKATA